MIYTSAVQAVIMFGALEPGGRSTTCRSMGGGELQEGFLERLRGIRPDLCVTAAYGNILPRAFLDIPRCGTLNIHPSLLPRWRGAAPVPRAIEVWCVLCRAVAHVGRALGPPHHATPADSYRQPMCIASCSVTDEVGGMSHGCPP